MGNKPIYRVVGAAIQKDGNILCAQRGDQSRSLAGYWEFPGGKVESGENEVDALVREMREECLCNIEVGKKVADSSYEYDFATINLTVYYCSLVGGSKEPQLTEHAQLLWVAPADLMSLQWAPADIRAVLEIQKSQELKA